MKLYTQENLPTELESRQIVLRDKADSQKTHV